MKNLVIGYDSKRTTGAPSSIPSLSGSTAQSAIRSMRALGAALTCLWLIAGSASFGQSPYLVKDILPDPLLGHPELTSGFVSAGGLTYFLGTTEANGTEIWRSDGTPPGTFIPRDFTPFGSGDPQNLTVVGNKVFYTGPGNRGATLYATDGSGGGTQTIHEFVGANPYIASMVPGDSLLYFSAGSGGNDELWRSDGTPQGTFSLRDPAAPDIPLNSGWGHTLGDKLIFVGSTLYVSDGTSAGTRPLTAQFQIPGLGIQPGFFTVNGLCYINTGAEVWSSDGTPEGTYRIAVYSPITGMTNTFTSAGGKVYFFTPSDTAVELWGTDGTEQGTSVAAQIAGTQNVEQIGSSFVVNGRLVFGVNSSLIGIEPWVSDGTANGTVGLDINPLGSSSQGYLNNFNFTVSGSMVYFMAQAPATGMELYATDGTSQGTHLVRDFVPGSASSIPTRLVGALGKLFFFVLSGPVGAWCSDGSDQGTFQIMSSNSSAIDGADDFAPAGNKVVFLINGELWATDGTPTQPTPLNDSATQIAYAAADGVYFFTNTAPSGLWVTDGTPQGTHSVASFSASIIDAPIYLADALGSLYFSGNDGMTGREVWKSDGTGIGTLRVADIIPGPPGSSPALFQSNGSTLFCSAYGGAYNVQTFFNREIWRTDGTLGGTGLIEVNPGQDSSAPNGITALGNFIFAATTPGIGRELWISDGTTSGTTLLKDINPSGDSNPANFTRAGLRVYFIAYDPIAGSELWSTDGTPGGTTRAKDISPGIGSTFIGEMAPLNGSLIFVADDGVHGRELWRSDGTEGGTVMVKDISPGFASSYPSLLAPAGDKLFFLATTPAMGQELWTTGGTEFGTQMVTDLTPGAGGSSIPELKAVGGSVYFDFVDQTHGYELWRSDGTPGGTGLFADLNPGQESSFPQFFTPVDGGPRFYFSAWDSLHGFELWLCDGTPESAHRVGDINPGAGSSNPGSMTISQGKLFFSANDGVTGYELWAVPLPGQPTPTPSPTPSPSPTPTPGPPTFVVQPLSQSVNEHQTVTFNVLAVGQGTITYQWYKLDGGSTPVSGATQPSLTLVDVPNATGGAETYFCRACDVNGCANSANATLTIFSPPLQNQAAFAGDSLRGKMFTGQSLLVGIKMINTSDLTWSKPQGYALTVQDDPSGLLGGVTSLTLPDPPFITPAHGGAFDFIALVRAPGAPGQYSVALEMTDGAAGLFGPMFSITVEVVDRPNASEDWAVYE